VKIRTWVIGGMVAAMAVAGPAAAFAGGGGGGGGGGNGGLLGLGGLLGGGDGGLLGGGLGGALGNGCNEKELLTVGGDSGLVGINLSGDLDLSTRHGLISTGDSQDDLVAVGDPHAGLIALLGNDPDLFREGLLGIATQCHHGDD